MNEFDFNPNKVELHQEADQRKEYKFIGHSVLPKGCRLYSFHTQTLEFKVVELTTKHSSTLGAKRQTLTLQEIINQRPVRFESKYKGELDPQCIYEVASNHKNAARKFNNREELKMLGVQIKLTKIKK